MSRSLVTAERLGWRGIDRVPKDPDTEKMEKSRVRSLFSILVGLIVAPLALVSAEPRTSKVPTDFETITSQRSPSGFIQQPRPVTSAPQKPSMLSLQRNASASELPFWRRKETVRKKMSDERAIVVSVRREDVAADKIRFTMSGAGWVARPKDFCFKVSQQYPRLREVSDHFRTVDFDPRTNQLFLITEALGYQARMILQVKPVSEDWRSELQWEVVWGHFKGMKGVMGFEDVGSSRTEVSINALYESRELPLPKALMGFALEVVTQKVAEKMRTFIESQPSADSIGARASES